MHILQVYAASILFGYFVRRVDKRFQLERSLSKVGSPDPDAVASLERLFAQVWALSIVCRPLMCCDYLCDDLRSEMSFTVYLCGRCCGFLYP